MLAEQGAEDGRHKGQTAYDCPTMYVAPSEALVTTQTQRCHCLSMSSVLHIIQIMTKTKITLSRPTLFLRFNSVS